MRPANMMADGGLYNQVKMMGGLFIEWIPDTATDTNLKVLQSFVNGCSGGPIIFREVYARNTHDG